MVKHHLTKHNNNNRSNMNSKLEAIKQDAHVEFLSDGEPVGSTGISKFKDHLLSSTPYQKEVIDNYTHKSKYEINTIMLFNKIRLSSNASQYIPVVFSVSCLIGVIIGAWMCL